METIPVSAVSPTVFFADVLQHAPASTHEQQVFYMATESYVPCTTSSQELSVVAGDIIRVIYYIYWVYRVIFVTLRINYVHSTTVVLSPSVAVFKRNLAKFRFNSFLRYS